jgi:cytochrome P450
MARPEPAFIPPALPSSRRTPGPIAALRSIRSPVLAWPEQVFDGGLVRSPYPGGPVIVSDPALAAEVLVEKARDFPRGERINRLFRPVWGRGVFVAEGEAWLWQRRAGAPAFRPAQMAGLVPIMRAAAEEVLEGWRGGRRLDLQAQMRRLTLKVLFDAALSGGEDFPDRREASRQLEAFISGVGRFMPTDFLPMPDRWRPPTGGRGGRPAAYVRAHVDAMVARRRREGGPRGDLVDLMMSAVDPQTGETMDDGLVRDNLVGFIAAGHETTSFALAWALWLITSHPATQARLLAEIEAVAGDEPIGGPHLEQLAFTRQVIQETMRLYPGAVALVRTAARDTSIGGRKVRRGEMVLIAVYALHRRADLWERPEAFDPDRFAPGRQAGRPAFAYQPFGAGPRACMGAAFAMTEITTVLATLVRGARLTPEPGRPVQVATRMGAAVARDGLWVSAARRD